jgi:Bifunctional DNA primase/polymerase, N-terminal/Primase C terminal 1 (PriCT-1)
MTRHTTPPGAQQGLEELAEAQLVAALGFAKRGCHVFPCKIDKKPITEHGFKDATTDTAQIEAWWRSFPGACIGVATGAVSGFFVLDVDDRHDGDVLLRRLEAAHGELPSTVEVITGGGGRHLYFRYPSGHKIGNSAGRLGDGLDVRGDGGYVIAPPSPHASGRCYDWSVDSTDKFADAPGWLLEQIAKPARQPRTGGAATDWRTAELGAVGEGARNDTLCRLLGHLMARDVAVDLARQLGHAWNRQCCQPPLPDDEVDRTLTSVLRMEWERRRGRRR